MRALITLLRRHRLMGLTFMAVMLCATMQKAAAQWSADRIEQTIISESLKTNYVQPSLALAVAETESNFRPHVVSHAGAVGVMQIMPATAFGLYKTKRAALFEPRTNIRIGVQFLDHLIKKYNGRIDLALSHYNGGSAVIKNGSARVLPYTRDYVSRVLARSKHYKNAMNKKTIANARRRSGQRPLAVQTLTKHAKPDQKTALATHINHVNKWLSVVNELAPHGR